MAAQSHAREARAHRALTGGPRPSTPTPEQAEGAIARLREMSADVRGCAILAPDGELLAAGGDPKRWQEAAAGLLGAADLAGDAPPERVHVATEDGEVFAVRHGGLAMVVVSERFALASLMAFDMRTVLRDLVNDHRQVRSRADDPDDLRRVRARTRRPDE